MSLVAYGSSDESEIEEEINEQPQIKVKSQETAVKNVNINTVNVNSKLSLPTPKAEPENNINGANGSILSNQHDETLNFNAIPKPGPCDLSKAITFDYAASNNPIKKEKGPTKILIPSLSDFKDLEEVNANESSKRKPSEKGTGLLGLLPQPKNATVSTKTNTMMIPHILTAKPIETKKPVPKKSTETIQRIQSKSETMTLKSLSGYTSESEDEDEHESASGIDFFSLSTPTKIPDELLLPINKTENDVINTLASSNTCIVEEQKQEESNTTLVSNIMNLSREEILLKNKAEVGPKLPIPEQEYNVDSEGNLAFDDKAIEYLCGKRGVKRKNELDNIDIVEISGEDIKPDEKEWLVKALTEEVSQRPISAGAGPSGKSKKKHQITYLAHQAKAMELELKNQWAQNKASRQQTRSKYGF